MANTRNRNAVIDALAKGEFVRAVGFESGIGFTSGTEISLLSIGSDTVRTIVPYLVGKAIYWDDVTDEIVPHEWFLIRATSSTVPELSSDSVVEGLMRDKRILDRGLMLGASPKYGDSKFISVKAFQVEIETGERLMWVIVPKRTLASNVAKLTSMEYRVVQVD